MSSLALASSLSSAPLSAPSPSLARTGPCAPWPPSRRDDEAIRDLGGGGGDSRRSSATDGGRGIIVGWRFGCDAPLPDAPDWDNGDDGDDDDDDAEGVYMGGW